MVDRTVRPSYSTAEVARRLGVSIPTVQRWVDAGHLRAWKTVGGHRRIDADSVEQFAREQGGASAQPLSVLVVDDNPDDRDILSALVETALPGATVAVAESGFEALMAIGQAMPDVVITDIVMPHMNGFEMLRHLRARGGARPRLIVAVSSRTPAQLSRLGELPQDVKYLAKPVDHARFVELLRSAAMK